MPLPLTAAAREHGGLVGDGTACRYVMLDEPTVRRSGVSLIGLYVHDTAATGLGCDVLQDTLVEGVLTARCGRAGPGREDAVPTACWSRPRRCSATTRPGATCPRRAPRASAGAAASGGGDGLRHVLSS
ncbi:hypothetical protein [Streptomyces sp. TRM68367]|uniref:hypothetical protein n=1 Tax=Streptomyces sp. TRM68367 TaxID=2758415 RepID=UPI0021D0989A|nr:hypothetical protein [Streptomyces sp. TRM68367]